MDSWSYVPDVKGFISDETVSPPDLLSKKSNAFSGWELKDPCSLGSDFLVPSHQITEVHGFGELGFQEMIGKRFQEDSTGDVFGRKVGGGRAASPVMAEAFSGEDESCSKPSSSVVESNSRECPFIDLKLGRLADSRDAQISSSSKAAAAAAAPNSPSAESTAPAKRVRGASLNSQTFFCQVHGCSKDLSSSKDYHKRHRVCEDHSKTPKVIVNGIEQRFCQQCSRFHLLPEFDDDKRSCRKRLAGHNERRRKPQASISCRGGRLLQSYNSSKANNYYGMALPASFICQDFLPSGLFYPERFETNNWCRHIKQETGTVHSPQTAIPTSSSHIHPKHPFQSYNFQKHHQYFQDNEINTPSGSIFSENSNYHLHNLGVSSSVSRSLFQNALLGSEEFNVFDTASSLQGCSALPNSSCALSLLSPQSQNSSSHSSGIPLANNPSAGPDNHAHYNVIQVSQKLLGVSPQPSTSGVVSNKIPQSRMSREEGNHLHSTFLPDDRVVVDLEVTDGIFQMSDSMNGGDCFSCQDGATMDLLQLSSQLQRVEHQRNSIQLKQENDSFCLRIT